MVVSIGGRLERKRGRSTQKQQGMERRPRWDRAPAGRLGCAMVRGTRRVIRGRRRVTARRDGGATARVGDDGSTDHGGGTAVQWGGGRRGADGGPAAGRCGGPCGGMVGVAAIQSDGRR